MIDLRLFGARRLTFIPASEINECALACLACVSEYFQGELGLSEIRQLAIPGGRGENLLALRNLAESVGLAARAVRIEPHSLKLLASPAILHWNMNHFVVLERVTRRGIIIMDPAIGRTHVSWSVVDAAFTGVALELRTSERWHQRASQARKVSALAVIGPLHRWRTDILLVLVLSLLLEVLVLLTPLQLQMSVDHAIQASDAQLVWVLGAGFTFVVLLKACVALLRAWSSTVLGTRVGFDLQDRFVRALHDQPAHFFLRHHTVDILSRARSINALQGLFTGPLIQVVLDTLTSLLMVMVMFAAVPLLASVVVSFGVLGVAVTLAMRHATLDNSRRTVRSAARAESLFLENARAARAIKLYGQETTRTSLWRNKLVELTNLGLAGQRLAIFSAHAAQLGSGLGSVALIAVGSYLVLAGAITLGTLFMFFAFRTFFTDRLNHCASFLLQLRLAQTHAERIDEILTAPVALQSGSATQRFAADGDSAVSIEVLDLWFRYGQHGPWILRGVSFRIEAGESVAITGASGCGKTTLMHILLGLLQPERGEVLINGRDLRTITTRDYAALIGVVLQDDVLFQGTVADNIAFFAAPVDMQRVLQAAEKANIAREIQAMPMHYYSLLSEAAQDISGGQKQRLFIARALYNDPKLLFLDEATSHLDSDSERLVSQAIRSLRLTRVLIAHRKETLATADRVLLLSGDGTMLTTHETGHGMPKAG